MTNPLSTKAVTVFVEAGAPDDISWLPEAIGWWWLLAALIGWLLVKTSKLVLRYHHNAYRRKALLWLDSLEQLDEQTMNQTTLDEYQKLPNILRTCAVQISSRSEVSKLKSKQWEVWLDSQCKQSAFAKDFDGQLNWLAYRCQLTDFPLQFEQLNNLKCHIRFWIENHRGKHD